MAGWIPALQAGASILGAFGQFQAGQQRRRDLSQITPSEREYIKRQEAIASGGDPMLQKQYENQLRTVVGGIRSQGREHMQTAEGSIVGQGLESSIVAAEIRRKTGADTMRNIAEQSRRLAEQNRVVQERAKQAAEDRILQMSMQREGRMAQLPDRASATYSLLGNIAQAGLGAWGNWEQQQQEQAWKIKQIEAGASGDF